MTDHYAHDERHALAIARRIIANLNRVKRPDVTTIAPEEPLYDPAELGGVIPVDSRKVKGAMHRGW